VAINLEKRLLKYDVPFSVMGPMVSAKNPIFWQAWRVRRACKMVL